MPIIVTIILSIAATLFTQYLLLGADSAPLVALGQQLPDRATLIFILIVALLFWFFVAIAFGRIKLPYSKRSNGGQSDNGNNE